MNMRDLIKIVEGLDQLNELFTQSVQTTWDVNGNHTKVDFYVDDVRYQIEFIKDFQSNKYYCGFHAFMDDSDEYSFTTDIIGNGKQFPVFATVVNTIKSFIDKNKPKSVLFTAEESSRIRLYNKMLKSIKIPGYQGKIISDGHYAIVRVDN